MKLKNFATCAILAMASMPVFAQYEGTSDEDRIGITCHGEDSIEVINNMMAYSDAYKAKNYEEAYEYWRPIITKAPLANYLIYTRGQFIMQNMIDKATEADKKKQYFQELMQLLDQRIKYMNEINSFVKSYNRFTKGVVVCLKAYYYTRYAPKAIPGEYKLKEAYDMFTEGIDLVNQDASKEVEAYVLDTYFQVSYQMYKNNPDSFREQFLKDYLSCKEVCEKMLAKANEVSDTTAAKKIVANYDPTLLRVEHIFADSKAADRDQLIAIFTPQVENNKTNLAYLRSVIRILSANDCDDTDVYFTASKYAFDIEPSYDSALGIARSYTKGNNPTEAVKYYDQALKLCPDDNQKAKIAYTIARSYARSQNYEKTHEYLTLTTGFNGQMAGRCDLLRSQMLAQQKKFDEAISFANRAAQEDVTISGTASRLAEAIQKVKVQNAEIARQNAEYQKAVAKKKVMDDFWNCK